jgi:hypothetical protein
MKDPTNLKTAFLTLPISVMLPVLSIGHEVVAVHIAAVGALG